MTLKHNGALNPARIVWTKSSHSGQQGDCVELGLVNASSVAVRDSKVPFGPLLAFGAEQIKALLDSHR